ncbi:MAG: hypothetical protein KDD82_01570 [Planctomycetes bacterium]|nr:hypothetical protein [Planctomycetota bacterium]
MRVTYRCDSRVVCPLCREALGRGRAVVVCPTCGAAQHPTCACELGGCHPREERPMRPIPSEPAPANGEPGEERLALLQGVFQWGTVVVAFPGVTQVMASHGPNAALAFLAILAVGSLAAFWASQALLTGEVESVEKHQGLVSWHVEPAAFAFSLGCWLALAPLAYALAGAIALG